MENSRCKSNKWLDCFHNAQTQNEGEIELKFRMFQRKLSLVVLNSESEGWRCRFPFYIWRILDFLTENHSKHSRNYQKMIQRWKYWTKCSDWLKIHEWRHEKLEKLPNYSDWFQLASEIFHKRLSLKTKVIKIKKLRIITLCQY